MSSNVVHDKSADAAAAAFARSVMSVAAQVEAAESKIKAEILRAAAAGDNARITDLVTRWINGPTVEVLADGEQRS